MHLQLRLPFAVALTASLALGQTQLLVPSQYPTVQAAIDAAPVGATILVSGALSVTTPIDTLGKALTLRGAAGAELLCSSSRAFSFYNGETDSTVIEGLIVRWGRAPNSTTWGVRGGDGGAMTIVGASPRFVGCVFDSCHAGDGMPGASTTSLGGPGSGGGHGGVAYVVDGAPVFDRCTFTLNRAGAGATGGDGADGANGINNAGYSAGNGGPGGDGAVVFATGSAAHVRLQSCVLQLNVAGRGGRGGQGGDGGDGVMIAGQWATFGGNGGAGGDGGNGGAALVRGVAGAVVDVVNCTFESNWPAAGGGAGHGGTNGVGVHPGTAGSDGAAGADNPCAGVQAGSTSSVANTVFWNLDHAVGHTATVTLVEVNGGAVAVASVSNGPITGAGCAQLATRPMGLDLFPLPTGPLVDAGDDSFVTADMTIDRWGNPRRFDHTWHADAVDIGAFEDTTAELAPFGCGVNADGALAPGLGSPRLGTTFQLQVQPPGPWFPSPSLAMLAISTTGALPSCGLLLPGFGMDPAAAGALLLDQPALFDVAIWAGSPTVFAITVPSNSAFLGVSLWLQGAIFDPTNGHIGLTRGLRAVIGQ